MIVLPTVRITWVAVVDIPMLAAASIKNTVIAIAIAVIPEAAFGVVVASPMTSMVAAIVVARIAATEVILGEAFRRANIWVAGVLSTMPLIVAILTVVITVVTAAVGAVGVTL